VIGKTVGHYEVLEKIGEGGIGEVYRAHDRKLGRDVALKVLSDVFSRDSDQRNRFQREARAAAALSHPNICTIFDMGTTRRRPYVVMELLEGRTLAQTLAEVRPLDMETAVRLGIQLSSAIAVAHDRGIVHRDVKPANIFITRDDRLKVVDFGLAKFTSEDSDSAAEDTNLTTTGTMLGTVAYMSPEQARGEKVDPRTDIHAVGAVLYEMVTGRQAYVGKSKAVVFEAILNRDPPSPGGLNPDVPDGLEAIITKALAKDLRGRYQSAADLVTQLEQLREGTLPAKPPAAKKSTRRARPSVAVLPFLNLSPDPTYEHFCDGITEDLTNSLVRVKGLRVASRTSAFTFKGRDHDIRQIGKKLNVKTIVEGSVRKAEDRLRITAQLVNVADGYHLWSERYYRTIENGAGAQNTMLGMVTKRAYLQTTWDRIQDEIIETMVGDLEAILFCCT
jgi:non-specific serine/threonine protein kinase